MMAEFNWEFISEGIVRIFRGDTKALFEVRIPKDAKVACGILNEQYQTIEALRERAEQAEAENARLVAESKILRSASQAFYDKSDSDVTLRFLNASSRDAFVDELNKTWKLPTEAPASHASVEAAVTELPHFIVVPDMDGFNLRNTKNPSHSGFVFIYPTSRDIAQARADELNAQDSD